MLQNAQSRERELILVGGFEKTSLLTRIPKDEKELQTVIKQLQFQKATVRSK